MRKKTPPRPARSASTALARRQQPTLAQLERRLRAITKPPPAVSVALATLPADPMMVPTFVGTLKLKTPQIAALRRPLEAREIGYKPMTKDGPPILPYVPHNAVRDRFDEAFGLGGWGLVPVAMPKTIDDLILVPYAFVVGGVPRIYAWGEQQYHPTNRQMTYGDALEGAKSNALVRCGKELGVARELWDRENINRLMAEKSRGGRQSRDTHESARADDRQGGSNLDRSAPPPARHANSDDVITEGQRKRLWAILKSSGRDEASVRAWLAIAYNITSTSHIRRRDYDAICRAIEAPGILPAPRDREPGEEG